MSPEIIVLQSKILRLNELHKKLEAMRALIKEDKHMVGANNVLGAVYDVATLSYKTGASVPDKDEVLSLYKMSTSDGGIKRSREYIYNEMKRVKEKIRELNDRITELSEG